MRPPTEEMLIMWPALPAHHRERSAGEIHDAIEVGVYLGAEILLGRLLERRDMAEAGVVDEHVQSTERLGCHLHGRPSG